MRGQIIEEVQIVWLLAVIVLQDVPTSVASRPAVVVSARGNEDADADDEDDDEDGVYDEDGVDGSDDDPFDFEAFMAFSDSDGSNSDIEEDVMAAGITEDIQPISDLSSDSESDELDEDDSGSEGRTAVITPLVAAPPKVLEPCHYIKTVPAVPALPSGYRICGDNIDKTVRPRYMLSNKGNQSLHYFHSYAVLNRIDVSSLSDSPVDVRALKPEIVADTLVPSLSDDTVLKKNMATLVSRVLVSHLKFFEVSCKDAVDWHIQHKFSQEMSQKSTVVSALPLPPQ